MKNKGFTLIEILAVIVILMILITLITPKVFKQLKTAENITDQEQINTIINISKIYMNQNTDLLPEENNIYTISIDELKQSGLIQTKQILNPSTKEELTGYIIVKNENNKYKYEYKEENELITVTFDSQGGTIQQTSKKLLTGEKYGTLPTPTREGYRFLGWNGKNLFTGLIKGKSVSTSNGNEVYNATRAGTDYIKVDLNSNNYYLSGITKDLFSFVSFYNQDKEYMGRTNGASRDFLEIKTSSIMNSTKTDAEGNIEYIKIIQYEESGASGKIDIVDNLNIQLEVGNTATPYEPYYITTNTTVVQENDHTLKAIWQANS